MYIPPCHSEPDTDSIYQLIDKHNFGTAIYKANNAIQAFHVPFVLKIEKGNQAKLLGHIARQNINYQDIANGQELLIIFSGPYGYISPAWYDRPTAPTWDFIKVHAYGTARLTDDSTLLDILDSLITTCEKRIGDPWDYHAITKMDSDYLNRRLPYIVGLEIPIQRLECQIKMSQDRSAKERACIAENLLRGQDDTAKQLVEYLLKI